MYIKNKEIIISCIIIFLAGIIFIIRESSLERKDYLSTGDLPEIGRADFINDEIEQFFYVDTDMEIALKLYFSNSFDENHKINIRLKKDGIVLQELTIDNNYITDSGWSEYLLFDNIRLKSNNWYSLSIANFDTCPTSSIYIPLVENIDNNKLRLLENEDEKKGVLRMIIRY